MASRPITRPNSTSFGSVPLRVRPVVVWNLRLGRVFRFPGRPGGGIIVVPALTLIYGIDIRYAIGASIVSVIATSSGAAAAYVREGMTNLRTAILLEIGTTTGAISGAFLAGILHGPWLYVIFGVMLAGLPWRCCCTGDSNRPVPPDAWADRLRLARQLFRRFAAKGSPVSRHAHQARPFLDVSGRRRQRAAGHRFGMLKVPAMDLAMRIPIKVSTATSNFMIGVTAAASAGVYFCPRRHGPVHRRSRGPGRRAGGLVGSRVLARIDNRLLRIVFVAILFFVSAQMIWKGFLADAEGSQTCRCGATQRHEAYGSAHQLAALGRSGDQHGNRCWLACCSCSCTTRNISNRPLTFSDLPRRGQRTPAL